MREPEDFSDDQRAAMIAGNVENELRTEAERGLILGELAIHPELTIPEMAVRIGRLTGDVSPARLYRLTRLVASGAGGLKNATLDEVHAWQAAAVELGEISGPPARLSRGLITGRPSYRG
jgi:hypothetical protein